MLTACLVSSGTRSRADVACKSILRVGGAVLGTILATLLDGDFAPGSRAAVVVIFGVVALASWLRSFSYAWWVAGVTAALALLYGYFGQDASDLLSTRVGAILVGGMIGVATSWLVVPVRATTVARRRLEGALAALAHLLAAACIGRLAPLEAAHARFRGALTQLDEIGPSLRLQRRLSSARRRSGPHPARPGRAAPALRGTGERAVCLPD